LTGITGHRRAVRIPPTTEAVISADVRIDHTRDAAEPPIEQLRAGRADALAALYREHAGRLLRLAQRLTGSADDAEDIVHDVFVGLPELLRRYEHSGRLLPWLCGVTARLAISRRRRERRRAQLRALLPREGVGTHDLWTQVDLERALEQLPESLRDVVVLHVLEGLPHDVVAESLGISLANSRVRTHRALRHLRRILEPGS